MAIIHHAFILTHGCRAFQKVCALRASVGGLSEAEKSHEALLYSAMFLLCIPLRSLQDVLWWDEP